ncbi:MAG: hypothetical protein IPP15_17325 [Saprospiraceae bacterium]|uniref:HEPN domain-containing protein n=1 Tax=Candidatus Opimibacter skivensis TaxID=2982028 RepID=A0A9D7XUW0_9BACT|nr:hypothetical protein [Candidatus Opimibacter skivensis]
MNGKNQIVDLLLDTAKGFHDIGFSCAAHLKEDQNRTVIQRMPVAAVDLSFSAELYLKAIHLLKKNLVRGHKLHDLFNVLDEKSKSEINELFIKHLDSNPDNKLLPSFELKIYKEERESKSDKDIDHKQADDLETFLKNHNQTFENWRYIHELNDEGYHLHANFKYFHCFISVLQGFIFIHKRGNDMFLQI